MTQTPPAAAPASAFSKHAQEEEARKATEGKQRQPLSVFARILLFLLFPTLAGVLGLVTGFVNRRAKNDDGKAALDFDQDFIFPFLITMAIVILLGFQTSGFTKKEPTPLVQWPKVRRKRKIIHKTVVVDDVDDGDADGPPDNGKEQNRTTSPRRRSTRKED